MDLNMNKSDKIFTDAYLKLIKEDFSQQFWHEREKFINDTAETEESGGELNVHNEFERCLERGLYSAKLTGTVDSTDGIVRWEVSDELNGDSGLGIEINGETEGERKVGEGQTINMVLENLYAEFKDAFEEIWEEYQQDNEQYQKEWDL